jgi:hypothetical protein
MTIDKFRQSLGSCNTPEDVYAAIQRQESAM